MQSINPTNFASLSEDEQKKQVQSLNQSGDSSPSSAQKRLLNRISGYEQEHGISTKEMLNRVSTGELEETAPISKWITLVDVLEDTRRAAGKT